MITPFRAAIMAAAAAALTILAGCGGSSPLTIHGTMQVTDFAIDGKNCLLSGTGYDDIAPGTQVTVTAPDGTVLGSGALGDPKAASGGIICQFPFTISSVQGGEDRYGVAVGRRGTVWFSPAKVTHAALELGN